jgi:hypothetical protein
MGKLVYSVNVSPDGHVETPVLPKVAKRKLRTGERNQ